MLRSIDIREKVRGIMQDIYAEYMVKRKPVIMMKVLFVLCVIMTVLNLMFCLISPFAVILVLAFFGLSFLVRRYSDIEYEYTLTNDVLDIDAVYQQFKRKRMKSIDLKQATVIAPIGHPALRLDGVKGYDYSSHEEGAARLGIAFKNPSSNRNEVVAFEPNETIREIMCRRYPNVFKT